MRAASASRSPIASARAPSDHRAGEARPLGRRVDRPHCRVQQLRVGIVVGDRIAEAIERRREELRQLRLEREMHRRQLPEPLEEIQELDIREPPKFRSGPPRAMGEEGASAALLGRSALDTAAALCLATGAAGTGLVAPDLRHALDRGAPSGRKARPNYAPNLRTALLVHGEREDRARDHAHGLTRGGLLAKNTLFTTASQVAIVAPRRSRFPPAASRRTPA
jgi:hypothetical protein